MEQEPKNNQEQPSESLDREWFREFKDAGGAMEAYDYFEGDKTHRQGQREKFEAGEIDNPELDYPKLNLADLNARDEKLSTLKQQIISQEFVGDEKMEAVQQVYRWKINEKLAEVRMLKASASGDMKRFQRYSEFVYGKPSPEIFEYTIASIREKIGQYKISENEDLKNALQQLDEALPEVRSDIKQQALPEQEVFEFAKEKTMKELGHLIVLPAGQDEFEASDIVSAFEAAMATAKIDGWKVVLNPNAANISASQERKEVVVPEKRKVSRDRISELALHEIGTHALRRSNGERSKLMLLGLGLDRNRDDEGVTGLREQILGEKMEDFSGLPGHLAISLASGVDGKPRAFREVYEIMQKYYCVSALADGENQEDAQKKSRTKAWAISVRTFRGTDCKTPGASFNKDILYREANRDVWEVVKNNPNEIMRFSVGKYDPANSRHIMILDQLGITDKDLEQLKQ